MLDLVFKERGYNYCFNVNIDDYYALNRFEKQLRYMQMGYDVTSSNIAYIDEQSNVTRYMRLSMSNYRRELNNDNNVIAHPVVCYSRRFWLGCGGYDAKNIPREDLVLWKKNMNRFKYFVINDILCFHRIHDGKVCLNPNNR